MSDNDDAWLNELAAELGESPLEAGDLQRLRGLARSHPEPWGPAPEVSVDLALARVHRRDAYSRQTRRRGMLTVAMAAALLFCASPTLVRWRVDRRGSDQIPPQLSQVGLVFWTSTALPAR